MILVSRNVTVLFGLSIDLEDELINVVLYFNVLLMELLSFIYRNFYNIYYFTDTVYYFDCTEYFVDEGPSATTTVDITIKRRGVVDTLTSISKYNIYLGYSYLSGLICSKIKVHRLYDLISKVGVQEI